MEHKKLIVMIIVSKKDNVTNEIYTAFVDDIKDIENIKDKKVIGGIYSKINFLKMEI